MAAASREFLSDLKKRHYQNYLALCPNHAAMFQHTNGSAELMREMFVELTGNELEVVLAQKNATIYFTRTHIADLKEVIKVDHAEPDRSLGEIIGGDA
jgi:inorganic pyrophosphatase/exopolyphosphatase